MSIKYGRKRLPSEYQEVEYIQTSGTQWINTGIFASNDYQVETKVEVTNTNQEYPVFGCYGANNVYTYYHLTCYQNKWYFGLNGSESNGGTYSPVIGTQYEIVYNNSNSQLNVNGTDVASTSGTVGASGTTLGISIRGNGELYGQYKYFYFKIYDKVNEEYVRDLVPCYRKSDDIIGMYDLVNDQFYTNSGSGSFTKGNDIILKDLQERYIGPIIEQVENYLPQTMTQLEQDGFVASGSSTLGDSSDYWRGAFFISTQGGTDHCFHSSQIGAGNRAYSQIQLPGEIVVDKIEIGARKNESSTNLWEIRAFVLRGSNDGTNRDEIKSVDGLGSSWSIGTVLSWDIEGQTTAYKYLKLEVQANRNYVAFDYWNVGGEVKEIKKVTEVYIGKELKLPVEYQEVEYIESDGSAYINTGILSKNINEIEMDISDIYQGSSYADQYSYIVFGTTASSWWFSSTYYTYNGARFRYHKAITGGPHDDCNAPQTGSINHLIYTRTQFTVNGNVGTQAGADPSGTNADEYPVCFWYCGNNSHSKYKMYSLKITTADGEHNYIPCYRKSDDVIGLYSLEDEEFYTNAGTGTFTKGNDILPYIKIRPTGGTQQIVIQAALSTQTNVYPLELTVKPKKITITFSSYHNSGRSDQGIYIGLNSNYLWGFNWGDGSNYSYDRCWLKFYTGSENRILQDKYAATGTRQTILTLEGDKSSVQQGEAAEKSGTLSSAQQDIVNNLFNDYTNLKLLCAGTRSYLTSDVVIDVEY